MLYVYDLLPKYSNVISVPRAVVSSLYGQRLQVELLFMLVETAVAVCNSCCCCVIEDHN